MGKTGFTLYMYAQCQIMGRGVESSASSGGSSGGGESSERYERGCLIQFSGLRGVILLVVFNEHFFVQVVSSLCLVLSLITL